MYHVVFATGSRADYGIVRKYLSLLNNDPSIDLGIIATGALLEKKYGMQVDLIREDGFKIEKEVYLNISTVSNDSILHVMSKCQSEFADYFSNNKIDLLIILGDRYEMLSVAIAASMLQVPILHIHGGEATFGNYDEFIRHCITKMSLYHFTATEEYRKRVIQLGENPKRVFYLGALGAENCTIIDNNNINKELNTLPKKKYFVVLFHPETLTNVDILEQTNELLNAISSFKKYKFVFLGSNADTNSNIIRERFNKFIKDNDNIIFYENLNSDSYHYLLKNSLCLIGNSSSGLIEAPSLGIYTINIGDRQKGRIRGNSVIDTVCKTKDIIKAMNTVIDNYDKIKPINPYFKLNAANEYYKTTIKLLKRINNDIKEPKIFYDIDFTI